MRGIAWRLGVRLRAFCRVILRGAEFDLPEECVRGGDLPFYFIQGIEAFVDLPVPAEDFPDDQEDQYDYQKNDKPANRGCEEGKECREWILLGWISHE